MRKTLNYLLMTLFFLAAACGKSRDKEVLIENSEDSSTDFYWGDGKKHYLTRLDNRSFVLFRSSDREVLLSTLSAIGVETDNAKINEYGFGGVFDMSGEAAYSFMGYQWADFNINHNSASEIPEVVYAAPYYSLPNNNYEFPLTNLLHVSLKKSGDITTLEKLAKEYNVGIIGRFSEMPLWYAVACTKESKGNALEVANSFYESGLFEEASPAFISHGAH